MIHIKKFLSKMSLIESRQNKDVILSITDARGLRDELTQLLADLHELNRQNNSQNSTPIQVEINGGSFK